MPELDTLRGIAVLMVVFYHGFGYPVGPHDLGRFHGLARYFVGITWAGWMGVNLFFALSGFLITNILLDSKNRPGYFKQFYKRRALRILPAYYFILIALPLLSLIPHYPRHVGLPFVGLGFIYCANLVDLFRVQLEYGPLWSLGVEEHFYLVWPAVVRYFTPKTIATISAVIVVASPALRLFTPGAFSVTWQNLDGLSMGAILAILARRVSREAIKRLAISCVLGALVATAIGLPFGVHLAGAWTGKAFRTSITDLFFVGVLTSFLLLGTSRYQRLVNIRWLKFFGYISYGVYLVHITGFDLYDAWHGPLMLTFDSLAPRFIFAMAGTTLFCWVMRSTFEEFFLRMKDQNTVPATQERSTIPVVVGSE